MGAFLAKWSNPLIIFLIFLFSISSFYKWKEYSGPLYQFVTDRAEYYSYLPAFFNNDDFFMEKYNQPGAALKKIGEQRKMPKYSFGLAVMYSPFYFIARIIDDNSSELSKFGLSKTYSQVMRLGSIFYGIMGLYILLITLNLFFSKISSIVAIVLIFFATNLSHYTVAEGEMPHVYLFFLFSLVILLSHHFWSKKNPVHLFLMAFVLGLITLIRPSEIIFALVPLLWGITDVKSFKERIHFFISSWRLSLISIALFLLPIIPYIIYTKVLTGGFFYDPYDSESFFFAQPKIFDFLFGFRKGWFTYTPIMLIVVIGFIFLKKSCKEIHLSSKIIIPLVIYIMSSWWCWWFGGSFGSRVMVQYYAILIFPLAALIEVIRQKSKPIIVLSMTLGVLFVGVNLHWSRKFSRMEIHWDSMTYESFMYTIKRRHISTKEEREIYESLLMKPDYEAAMTGKNR